MKRIRKVVLIGVTPNDRMFACLDKRVANKLLGALATESGRQDLTLFEFRCNGGARDYIQSRVLNGNTATFRADAKTAQQAVDTHLRGFKSLEATGIPILTARNHKTIIRQLLAAPTTT